MNLNQTQKNLYVGELNFILSKYSEIKLPSAWLMEELILGDTVIRKSKLGSGKYYYYSLSSLLEDLFKNKEFKKEIDYFYLNKEKLKNSDCYGGSVYKKFVLKYTKNPNSYSVTVNTDGVVGFVSSVKSIWPIYIVFNELPLRLREKYMRLIGVYVGRGKPCFKELFKNFVKDCNEINSGDAKIVISDFETEKKIIFNKSCCDLPACAGIWSMVGMFFQYFYLFVRSHRL